MYKFYTCVILDMSKIAGNSITIDKMFYTCVFLDMSKIPNFTP